MNTGRMLADINNNILQLNEELYKFNIGMRMRINDMKEHMDGVGRAVSDYEKGERQRAKVREEESRKEEIHKPAITDEPPPDSTV